jgi:hypothetical protein
VLAERTEALVYILAHELRHMHQQQGYAVDSGFPVGRVKNTRAAIRKSAPRRMRFTSYVHGSVMHNLMLDSCDLARCTTTYSDTQRHQTTEDNTQHLSGHGLADQFERDSEAILGGVP